LPRPEFAWKRRAGTRKLDQLLEVLDICFQFNLIIDLSPLLLQSVQRKSIRKKYLTGLFEEKEFKLCFYDTRCTAAVSVYGNQFTNFKNEDIVCTFRQKTWTACLFYIEFVTLQLCTPLSIIPLIS
jgi:hypothetical protein